MLFYLGTHRAYWLRSATVPLFVSRTTLAEYAGRMPAASAPWALDSGGFTELDRHGGWTIAAPAYAAFVRRTIAECGAPDFAAPQDWMVEERMLRRTGLTVRRHQALTVDNFLDLRERLGDVVIPVLQGWTLDDYLRCVEMYALRGVDLASQRLVGLGTVCRRQHERPTAQIVRRLARDGLRLHGFGVKVSGLTGQWAYADALASCDSMAWSLSARWDANHGLPSCDPAVRRSCANCLHYALSWRDNLLAKLEASCAS